jgi:hypothetical protein
MRNGNVSSSKLEAGSNGRFPRKRFMGTGSKFMQRDRLNVLKKIII